MKNEKPILFQGEMIRAILDGRKTQTRRIIKPQPHPQFLARGVWSVVPQWPHQDGVRWFMKDGCSELVKCPHGKPGDELWVRETWGLFPHYESWRLDEVPKDDAVLYRAANPALKTEAKMRWKPSIHMPRWASRIQLKITDIQVEQVQEISERDAEAEGIDPSGTSCGVCGEPYPSCVDAFKCLWETINGKREGRSWDDNPWVWKVSFKRIKP